MSGMAGDKHKTVIRNLTPEQKQALLEHFDQIYECKELTDHEYKIIYLALMWATGKVYRLEDGFPEFDENEAEISMTDYEITFEDEDSVGVNLDWTYIYYSLDKIIKIIDIKD